jgi:hypothetical protein
MPPRRDALAPRLATLVADCVRWDFDLFSLAEDSNGYPLYFVFAAVLERFGIHRAYNLPPAMLRRVAEAVEHSYSFDPSAPNKYHNSMHGADVLQVRPLYSFSTRPPTAR